MSWAKLANNLWVQYGLLALAVMLPLLLPGFVLTLDLVFTPQLAWPSEPNNTYLFDALLHILNLALPSELIEKILLLAILVLSGVGAHKLVLLLPEKAGTKRLYWGAYFAGIFYMINPFVYSRFMAGQHLVLLGYALTPLFITALIKLVRSPSWKNAAWLALWASLIAGLSLHFIGILLVASIIFLLSLSFKQKPQHLKKLAVYSLGALGIVLLVNAYWFVPTMFGKTGIAQATDSFNTAQYEAFATNGQGALGALGNVLRLQGFWADARDMYELPQQQMPAWGLVFLAIWALVMVGAVKLWRINKNLAAAFGLMALTAILLATLPVISWLAPNVPFVAGYREPQKFVALLALVYAVFAAFGVAAMLGWFAKKYSKNVLTAMAGAALILPIICTPTMLWGFGGQLSPKSYPADWYAVNDQLNADTSATKVLFLPWHQYINFSFTGRIIANPAPKFFNKPTVAGDNPEYKGIQPTVPNYLNRRVEQEILMGGDKTTRLGERLSNLGFSHLILAKEYDYQDYSYLDHQTDLALVSDTDTLKLYAVMKGSGQ